MQIPAYIEPIKGLLNEKSIRYFPDCDKSIGMLTSPKIETTTTNFKKKLNDALDSGNVFSPRIRI